MSAHPPGEALTLAELRNLADTFGFTLAETPEGLPVLRDKISGGGAYIARHRDGDRYHTWRAPRLLRRHDEIRIALGLPTYAARLLQQH